jgi:hypothetical protein
MFQRSQNKLLVICIAIVATAVLVGVGVLLDVLVPNTKLAGFFLRNIPLAVVIPFILIGFNALCDRCEGQSETNRVTVDPQARPTYRGNLHEVVETECRDSLLNTPNRQKLNGDASAPIIVPVSIHERSVRSVVRGKKWWVGQ